MIMNTTQDLVRKHYATSNVFKSVLDALILSGKDINNINIKDLSPVDQFHIRGLKASQELASLCGINEKMKVLDIGCGLGGTARFIALEFGCHVLGVDISEEYCNAASKLSELVGLSSLTEFKSGDAVDLLIDDAKFDLVWSEHVQVNVENKKKYYSEIYRVLKTGGQLAIHEVFQEKPLEIYYPVPWADDESINFISTKSEFENVIKEFGFRIKYMEDKTVVSANWFMKAAEKVKNQEPPPLSLQILMGKNWKEKFINMAKNLSDKRIMVIQGILVK